MGKAKHHGIPESAKDMMVHFGKAAFELNAYEKKFIREQGFDTEYLFMETREDRENQRGWCSHCRKWLPLPVYTPERLAHNEKVKCPKCGYELTIKHAWRLSKKMYDEALVYLYRPSVLNPEIITARAVVVQRWWGAHCITGSPVFMKPDVYFDSFYVFEPGVGGKMLKPIANGRIYWKPIFYPKQVWYEMAAKPFIRDRVYERTACGWGYRKMLTITADIDGAFRAAENSPLRYGMEDYWSAPAARDYFLRYWHWAARYPSVEKLVKIGLGEIVAKKIMWGGGGNCINWRGKDLAAILHGRLTKADKAFLLTDGHRVELPAFQIWQIFDGKLSFEEAVRKESKTDWRCHIRSWERIKRRGGKIEKAMRYIERKKDRTPDLYADYLDECEKLGYDMTDKAVLFPKDLQTAHAHTAAQIKYQENQKLEAEYAKKRRPGMRKKYEWAAMGMMVVVPEHVSDLIAEGEKQHNCVGGYMERVATGQTDVVFVRKEAEPEVSYITMEIHNGRIIQARTKNNEPLDQLGREFVDEFRTAKLEKKKKARKTA